MDLPNQLTLLLADLPHQTRVARGNAFELVSDYALRRSVDFGHEIATIERFETWAHRNGEVKARDLGVDRIITTHNGELWAVQNKGYAAGSTVSHEDMSKFILAAKTIVGVTRLLLITSGPGLTANAAKINRESDSRVVVLSRQWLEAAAEYPTTYKELRELLLDPAQIPEPFILRPDQHDAVHNVTRHLQNSPEVQCIMACGTGKTVLSEAIAKAVGAKVIVFFVPSLGLMRQTIRSWRRQTGIGGMNAIAVCSDDTVGRNTDDAMILSDDDIPCEVLRDPKSIAEYIKAHTGPDQTKPVVVFCTYHSELLVVNAQHKFGAPRFDLAFCDEAHFLVGTKRDGGRIGEFVKRKNDGKRRLKAQYRVYATATPRLLSQRAQQMIKTQGVIPMDSMDSGSPVFGPVAHTLTFGEAITLGILANYTISVVAVSEQQYADFINNRAYVEANESGQILDAQTFASIEALKLAYRNGDKRIISYSNRVASARTLAELIDADPDLPGADVIWGELPANQRDARVNKISRPEGHVLTNVRCLNEGIDIPTLDAIMFSDPKTSPIDIAQGVGRVLRSAPGKIRGHIIIPVAIPAKDWETGTLSDEERDEAVTGPNPYKNVFEVLNAMSSHDETIRHILTALRLGLNKRKNATGIDSDEAELEGEELQDYINSIVNPDGSIDKGKRAPDEGEKIFGDKVVLHTTGMTPDMRKALAESIRLATVRESTTTQWGERDHLLQILVYGEGMTYTEAEKYIDESFAAVNEEQAA